MTENLSLPDISHSRAPERLLLVCTGPCMALLGSWSAQTSYRLVLWRCHPCAVQGLWKGVLPSLVMVLNPTVNYVLYEWLLARLAELRQRKAGAMDAPALTPGACMQQRQGLRNWPKSLWGAWEPMYDLQQRCIPLLLFVLSFPAALWYHDWSWFEHSAQRQSASQ